MAWFFAFIVDHYIDSLIKRVNNLDKGNLGFANRHRNQGRSKFYLLVVCDNRY
jgi:hypothetical protein